MTAATVPPSAIGAKASSPHIARLVMVAIIIAVLMAASFVIGRVTEGSATRTLVIHSTPATQTGPAYPCRMGRAC